MSKFRFLRRCAVTVAVALGIMVIPPGACAEATLDPALVEQVMRQAGDAPTAVIEQPGPDAAPDGLFAVYAQNRRADRAHYITVDLLLTAYTLIRQATQAEFERDQLRPRLIQWIQGLAQRLPADQTPVTAANRDFLAVAAAALSATDAAPTGLSDRAQAEWRLVDQAAGSAVSPLWEMPLDYGQFRPRGPYTASPETAATFRGLRYLGAILFPLQPSPAIEVNPAGCWPSTGNWPRP